MKTWNVKGTVSAWLLRDSVNIVKVFNTYIIPVMLGTCTTEFKRIGLFRPIEKLKHFSVDVHSSSPS